MANGAGRRDAATAAEVQLRESRESDEADREWSLVPFSYASPFHNPKELRERRFTLAGADLVVQQNWRADGKGGTELGFGAAVYEAAFLLSDYLQIHDSIVRGKRVLELGCGVGLVSIVSALLGARAPVLATDGDEASVALARANASRNGLESQVASASLRWDSASAASAVAQSGGAFDVVLGADIVCFPYKRSFDALLETLVEVSRPGTSVWIAHKPRDPSERAFFARLGKRGFELRDRIGPEALHGDFLHEGISLLHFVRQ